MTTNIKSNPPTRPIPTHPEDWLELARSGDADSKAVLASLPAEVLAAGCVELDAKSRGKFLIELDDPGRVVPLLPEAEFALALNAVGKDEAGWLLAFSTEEQRIACIDMDCFDPEGFQPERMVGWIDAMIDAGPATLAAAFEDLDPEIWALGLRSLAHFSIGAAGDDVYTEDGVVFYTPYSDEDYERVREVLQTLVGANSRLYWQVVYAAMEGATAECEQWAIRWRDARLADLGFPPREHAMLVYRRLSIDSVEFSEPTESFANRGSAETTALIPRRIGKTLLGESLRQLSSNRASELLGYVAGVANALAIADRLELGDAESATRASDKALAGIDLGLRMLVEARGISAPEVLDRVTALQLFRLGATRDPDLRGGRV